MSEPVTDLKRAAEERYLNYALSVITSRALPDVRDGLKPVQRRILYAMYQNLGLAPGSKPRKSAAVVGEVLGKYHPHGDVAAYEAMVRMAQPFALRYPLVHGEGNFGSLDGDGAAAMRYTEVRLARVAAALLEDLENETVPFRATYDATREEPAVLPAAVPQLLMNGSTGIAVGMATNIPPHNLCELVEALVAMIDNPKTDTKALLKFIKGPDFPTGGEILNSRAELRALYESGQGAIRLRGEYKVESLPRGKRQIVITSVPYSVNKATLVESIAEHVIARKLPHVVDVRDESTDDVRVVLELKSEASPELAMAYLYKHTELSTTFNVNLTCLVPTANPLVGQPARLSLAEICRHFLDFRLEVVTRRLEHERRKLDERLHILDGFAKIHADLDRALKIIRHAESRADAATKLGAAFSLDAAQADAILEIRLYQLARLEISKIQKERKEKRERLGEIDDLLKKPKRRWSIIREELERSKADYGDKRRTMIARGEDLSYDPEAYIVHEETTVVVSRDGWVKRVRELKDPASTRLREGDALFQAVAASTRDRIAFFSAFGGLYILPVNDLPATTGYGEPIQSLVRLADNERLTAVYAIRADKSRAEATKRQGELFAPTAEEGESYLLATARGFGFRFTPDLSETTRAGRKVARVSEADAVVSVSPIRGERVVCAAARGKMLRFPLADVPELSGPGKGVYLMRPGDDDDRIVGALAPAEGASVIVSTVEGGERKLSLDDVPEGKRAGKGLKVVKRGQIAGIRVE
ncbi:MAG TPA: DNA topoisomerase IV subunit A [Candidatus Binatia bacterium]|nr:DNA topoisomerase IV subunit A [Candidatus Binatia bacterium]